MKKAVFLDKDGTIINNIPYNIDFSKITINSQTIKGLQKLQEKGYLLIIVTNQSGIAKNIFLEHDFVNHLHQILNLFLQHGIFINSYYYCPHNKETSLVTCMCRKPRPGMIIQAAKDFSIDLSNSWMVGDILNDIEAGNTARVKTILIDNGNETEWILTPPRIPTHTVKNFYRAAEIITD